MPTIIGISNGGTGTGTAQGVYNATSPLTTLGDIIYHNGTNVVRLAGNTTASKLFLTQTGTGSVSAIPAWGAISAADVPTLNQSTTGTAANITGTLAVSQGGTGATSTTGSGANVLANSPTLVTPALGTPSAVVLTNATGLPLTTGVTGTLPVGNGGTGVTTSTGSGANVLATSPTLVTPVINVGSDATGDIYYRNSSGILTRLGIGSNGQVLTVASGLPSWAAASGGGGSAKPTINFQTKDWGTSAGEPTYTFTNNTRYANWSSAGDMYITGVLPTSYAGGGLTLVITYYQSGDGDTAHNIQHSAAISRVQSGTTNATSSSFASAQSMTSRTVANAASNILVTDTITFTSGAQMDNLAAGESFALKITKGGSVTGTVYLHSAYIRET